VARRSAAAWRALAPRYRARLTRAFGSEDTARRKYLSGVPLGAARGHAEVGEHRTRVDRGLGRGLTESQAAGRPTAGEVSASGISREFYDVPIRDGSGTRLVTIAPRNAGQAGRLGRYLSDLGNVARGVLPADEFARRWKGRQVAGYRVEHDAARALEAVRRAGPPPGGTRYRRVAVGPVAA
jgi:hypothetical protein